MKSKLILFFVLTIGFSSCYINSNFMLKTPKEYQFKTEIDSITPEYKIVANDVIQFRLYANSGFKLIDLTSGTAAGGTGGSNNVLNVRNNINYLIQKNGIVRLPIIGDIDLTGNTVREAEFLLQDKYKEFYIKPFVQLTVTNKRAFIFPGNGSAAQVIPLANTNTTLIEALAAAGGVAPQGRANRIKLMRMENGKREVYLIDLSTIEGLKYTDLIVQANDFIYVEPVPELTREVLRDITPIVSIVTSAIVIYTAIQRFGN
jgi:polysaccharide export outer membrane protein